eukprot:TRINITY_DN73552_c0_g1_i1.p1 TRINITY_DN73552_c0_g1~~TRINITY_DN73552_c0_g1_i1.p1  ORF type:complete len:225 (+),score=34.16 TRINITY_DN73552_c0_g1_i1:81-677(+)
MGHGRSHGNFSEGTIGSWTEDALFMLDTVSKCEEQVIVGSSMGAWIGLLLALRRPQRVCGLLGVAASPDFVVRVLERMDDASREDLKRTRRYLRPSTYSAEPYVITQTLLDEGSKHLVLEGEAVRVSCPVRLMHGLQDADVPWETSLKLMQVIGHDDVELVLVKGGDHRLSSPSDLLQMVKLTASLCERQFESKARQP